MGTSYRILGVKLTNYLINNTVGDLFTSGETIDTMKADCKAWRAKNIGNVVNYSVEGLPEHDEKKI